MFTYNISIQGGATGTPIIDIRFTGASKAALDDLTAIAHELKNAVERIRQISLSQATE